ncbi:MAG: hypothetical protein LBP57_01995 [Endomicrobium sp.]|nr:hypothetical protein [Endomicrobium sp.]
MKLKNKIYFRCCGSIVGPISYVHIHILDNL